MKRLVNSIIIAVLAVMLASCCNSNKFHTFTKTAELVQMSNSLNTSAVLHGAFILGCGGVNGEMHQEIVYAMYIKYNGSIDLFTLNGDNSRNQDYAVHFHFIDSTETPHITHTYKINDCAMKGGICPCQGDTTLFSFSGGDFSVYDIYVPEGSIVNAYNINLDGIE